MALGDSIWNFFFGNGSPLEGLVNPSSWWDKFKNGRTNEVNQEIANQNLFYQMQRNEIEDQRYEDETAYNRAFAEDERAYQRMFAEDERAYNRAFAEDERAYNRALQQEIFNREDTAIERQASQLSKLGINPASQVLNGLGAGAVVGNPSIPSSIPGSSSAPGLSSRGGSTLHNDFKMQDVGMLPLISALGGLADTVNGISTGQYERDKLALENDRRFLENYAFANEMGIEYLPQANLGKHHDWKNGYHFINENGEKMLDSNEYFSNTRDTKKLKSRAENADIRYKLDHEIYDSSNPKINFVRELSNLDFENIASRFMTNMVDTGTKLKDDLKKDFGEQSVFNQFFKLFF